MMLGIIVLGLLLSGNAYADKCYNPVATPLILESDKKNMMIVFFIYLSTILHKDKIVGIQKMYQSNKQERFC